MIRERERTAVSGWVMAPALLVTCRRIVLRA